MPSHIEDTIKKLAEVAFNARLVEGIGGQNSARGLTLAEFDELRTDALQSLEELRTLRVENETLKEELKVLREQVAQTQSKKGTKKDA